MKAASEFGKENYTLNPSLHTSTDMAHLNFLGMLMGISMRTNTSISAELPTIFWKQLVGQKIDYADVVSWDDGLINKIEEILKCDSQDYFDAIFIDYKFETELTDGTIVELEEGGSEREVTFENRIEYAKKILNVRLREF